MCEYRLARIAIRGDGTVAIMLECPEHGTVMGISGAIAPDAHSNSPDDVQRIADTFDYIVGRQLVSQGMDGLSRTSLDPNYDSTYSEKVNDPLVADRLRKNGFPIDRVPNPLGSRGSNLPDDNLSLAIRAMLQGLPMNLPDEINPEEY